MFTLKHTNPLPEKESYVLSRWPHGTLHLPKKGGPVLSMQSRETVQGKEVASIPAF